MSDRSRWPVAAAAVVTISATLFAADPPKAPARWFSMSVAVEGLGPDATFTPVSQSVDFSAALAELQVAGAVDEHSLRWFRVPDQGEPAEEPVQFSPAPQPRSAGRKLLPGTPASVSYLGEYPAGVTPEGLRGAGNLEWIAQADHHGRARYRLDFAVRQEGRSVQVPFPPQNWRMFDGQGRATPVRWFPVMQIHPQWPSEGLIQILDHDQLATAYHLGPVLGQTNRSGFRRPFFYPVNGPDGIGLTELGKPHDPTGSHAHHYSLWIAHANVAGTDFWSEKGGVIAHEQFEVMEDGPLFCRIVERAHWTDGPKDLVKERRELKIYRSAPEYRLIDVDLQLTSAGAEPLVFGKTTFGFLAARIAQSMTVFDGAGEILNANGDRNEQGAHLKRAPWIDQSGPVAQDNWNGLALFDHPQNPNFPTAWHCRNDGWAGAAFNMDGPYRLDPAQTLHLRYRVLLHRYDAVRSHVAERFAEYASQPIVHLGKPTVRQIPQQ